MKRKNFLKSLLGIPIAAKAVVNANAKDFHEHIPEQNKEIGKALGHIRNESQDIENQYSTGVVASTSMTAMHPIYYMNEKGDMIKIG